MEETVKIDRLGSEELDKFVDLIKLFGEVFEMKDLSLPGEKHLQKLLSRSDFDAFIALNNNKVVGGLTIYLLDQYYSEKPLAYIYDLAVRTNDQRQGIGKKLIEEVKKSYKLKGFQDVFVQAEEVDKHAIEFYRSTDPSEEEQLVYFSYSLNKQKKYESSDGYK